MAYRIAVLDDDIRELYRTMEMLSLYGKRRRQYELEITYFQAMKPFMEEVCGRDGQGKWTFDILLMDVYLPDGDGIESAKILREKGYEGVIIFKSSSLEDAIEAYAVSALHYLVKPVSQEKFDSAMDKAVKKIRRYGGALAKEEINVQPAGGVLLIQKEPEGEKLSGHRIKRILEKWNKRFRRSDR